MAETSEMVERVARAMCRAAMIDPDWCDHPLGPHGDKPQWQRKAALARAAISAMREEDVRSLLTQRKFEKQYLVHESGCWLWQGAIDRRDGYGRFYDGGKTLGAHQYAFRIEYGDIGSDKVIDHTCRCRHCVNPKHMRAISSVQNVMCGVGITANNLKKEVCAHGHPLHGENLYVRPDGDRDCRTCRTEASRRYKLRKRAMIDAALPSPPDPA